MRRVQRVSLEAEESKSEQPREEEKKAKEPNHDQKAIDEIDKMVANKKRTVLKTYHKMYIQKVFESISKRSLKQIPEEMVQQIGALLFIASRGRFSTPGLENICEKMISRDDFDVMKIVDDVSYQNPYLIPQQFIDAITSRMAEKLFRKQTQSISVYYLLDQVVGYKFQDGTQWTMGNRIKLK